MKAIWNGETIASSDDTVVVDGNHSFPADSLERRYLRESDTTSICPWKGTASYYDVLVADEVNSDAAWFYPEPKEAAEQIRGHVAFWRGVEVVED